MTLRSIILFGLFLIAKEHVNGQDTSDTLTPKPLHTVSVNIAGNGALLGISFERIALVKENMFFSFQAGAGLMPELFLYEKPEAYFFTIPHHITFNIGKGREFFEAGVGGALVPENDNQTYLFYPTFGYRFQPFKKGGLQFRLYGSIPIYDSDDDDFVFFPVGLSFGIAF